MTPERAAYHRLMLLCGLREAFDRELDQALEVEDPIRAPILDLAFCMSDLDQTISVLYNYTLRYRVDWQQVYDMLLAELRRQYAEKLLTPIQLAHIMFSIARNCDDPLAEPWEALCYPSYAYELVEEGFLSGEVFNAAFEAFLLHGQRPDVWAMEKERQEKKKKPLRGFFRKRKGKEAPR